MRCQAAPSQDGSGGSPKAEGRGQETGRAGSTARDRGPATTTRGTEAGAGDFGNECRCILKASSAISSWWHAHADDGATPAYPKLRRQLPNARLSPITTITSTIRRADEGRPLEPTAFRPGPTLPDRAAAARKRPRSTSTTPDELRAISR